MSDESTTTKDAELETIDGIGPARAEALDAQTVGALADSSAQHVYNQTESMSSGAVEDVVEAAREAIGEPMEANVYAEDEDRDDPSQGANEESFGDDVDAFIDASSVTTESKSPEDCDSVAILAGDDAFDHDGKHGDMDAEQQAGLVEMKLEQFGFDPEVVYALGSGMGRKAVNAWAGFTKNETSNELPELRQISVEPSGDYPDGDDYRNRNDRLLDAVDGICVVANGEYIGMWVNMVNEHEDCIIRTPNQDDE